MMKYNIAYRWLFCSSLYACSIDRINWYSRDAATEDVSLSDQSVPDDAIIDAIIDTNQCLDTNSDPQNCGQCGNVCRAPQGASVSCTQGTCDFACAIGWERRNTECDPPAPRLLSPLSATQLTTQRPVLRFELPTNVDTAVVELCSDSFFSRDCQSAQVMGNMFRPTNSLAPGVWFWRARSVTTTGFIGTRPTVGWQIRIPIRDSTTSATWGEIYDANNDGIAELVVGAGAIAVNGFANVGRAYLYIGSRSSTVTSPTITFDGPDGPEGRFGARVASAGDTNGDGLSELLVGAPNAMAGVGAVHIYQGRSTGPTTTPMVSLTGPAAPGSNFGLAITSVGDINQDGYGDIAVGADGAANGFGQVYIYPGSSRGPDPTRMITLNSPDGASGRFGAAIAGSDINADGFTDLIVSSYRAATFTGRVHVFLGNASGVSATPSTTITGPDGTGGNFGWSLTTGDFNSDGFPDVVVGAYAVANSTGRVYCYLGGASGIAAQPSVVISGPGGEFGAFGWIIDAGDVNQDGFSDLAVGAYRTANFIGNVYIFSGGINGLNSNPLQTLVGGSGANSSFGSALSLGDSNGDGFADLAVGANAASNRAGQVFVYRPASGVLGTTPTVSLSAPDGAMGAFGESVTY